MNKKSIKLVFSLMVLMLLVCNVIVQAVEDEPANDPDVNNDQSQEVVSYDVASQGFAVYQDGAANRTLYSKFFLVYFNTLQLLLPLSLLLCRYSAVYFEIVYPVVVTIRHFS
jgi:hypothetical protein